jgi:hypothetical protein
MVENVGLWERVTTVVRERGAEGEVSTAEDRSRRSRIRSRSKEKAVSPILVPEEPPTVVEKTQDSDPDPDKAAETEGNASGCIDMAAEPDSSKVASTLFSEGRRQSIEVKTIIEKMREDEEY